MARKRKVSEDSDSEEFDEPELSLQDEPKNIKRKKSTGPGDILVRLCESIMQRDSYRFFSIPVNVKKVTDYLRIIKAPMDLGTMKKKAQKREYSSLEEFQADFDLIVSNAKLYNGPDSVYSKEAEKLHEYGKKLIANEMLNQLTAPVADSQSASGKSHEVNNQLT